MLEPMIESDAGDIARWATSAEEARQWGGCSVPWPLDASVVRAWHKDSDVRPYVLRKGGATIAYGELWIDDEEREVELARIIVRPERRDRGAGRLLVDQLLQQAATTGYPTAFVRVVAGNEPALACYRAAGFVPVSAEEQRRFNVGQPFDYLWLRRRLRRRRRRRPAPTALARSPS